MEGAEEPPLRLLWSQQRQLKLLLALVGLLALYAELEVVAQQLRLGQEAAEPARPLRLSLVLAPELRHKPRSLELALGPQPQLSQALAPGLLP